MLHSYFISKLRAFKFSEEAIQAAAGAKGKVADLLVEHLLTRFAKEYRDEVLKALSIFDRMTWDESKSFGVPEIKLIGKRFRVPLEYCNYSEQKVSLCDFPNTLLTHY